MNVNVDNKNSSSNSIGDGMVQDTSGDVIFRISFFAIACLPEENEVLDGKVIEVTGSGIQVQSGPIKCFISMKVNKANSPNPALRI